MRERVLSKPQSVLIFDVYVIRTSGFTQLHKSRISKFLHETEGLPLILSMLSPSSWSWPTERVVHGERDTSQWNESTHLKGTGKTCNIRRPGGPTAANDFRRKEMFSGAQLNKDRETGKSKWRAYLRRPLNRRQVGEEGPRRLPFFLTR